MGTINAKWHLANKMPKNATFAQRVKWHEEHAKNCTCRIGDMPPAIKKAIEAKKKN